jgi:hypothetical protein
MQWVMSTAMNTGQGMNPMVMMMGGMFSQIQGTVGMSAVLDGGRVQGEIFLPSELLQSVAMIGMQAAMGGGGQPAPSQPQPSTF